ncbi:hypothetical protein TRIATDRAFT_302463 [Trichoderma atroviride IMI 206040]|uniref:Uncharacterized protein n=1 Tax=Hypocrea atroviridis (strain ATCC 20476 / IMI 206040) TaxID=452589 RepID=G9PA89_HYPAI|nr:uncharacterized protein TRIATDRAFT_259794 [Trichoderma atroviride IMI 206040]EHK39927.1 hypothetical protein TRIATDRAFT_302463 [Trichoderma atroviride IMI 206040]
MKTYIQDDDGDLPYKLMVISNNDNNNEGANEGTPTAVGQPETNAAAANNSPISDTGTWEIVNPGDGN